MKNQQIASAKVISFMLFFSALQISQGTAQIGIHANYINLSPIGNTTDQSQLFPHRGISMAVDYKFAFKSFRLELLPALRYTTMRDLNPDISPGERTLGDLEYIALELTSRWYPFNWYGDCTCPTLYNENDFFKNSLHFIALLGYQTGIEGSDLSIDWNRASPYLGSGLGLDIALWQFLQISPYVIARYTFPAEIEEDLENFAQFNLMPGIRINFHFINE